MVARQRLKPLSRTLAGSPHLLEIQLVQQREQPHHADRIAFPRGVELLLLLEEGGQFLAHEQDAVLRLLCPGHHVGRARQIERVVRPQATGHAPAGLDLIEDERHVVDPREQPQLAHESRARQAHATFALNRLDEHRRDATRSPDDVGREARALRLHERSLTSWSGRARNSSSASISRLVGTRGSSRRAAAGRTPADPTAASGCAPRGGRSPWARLSSSNGNEMCGQSNVGNPRRAFLRCVTARPPSVRPWNAPSNETMKPPSPSADVITRFRSTDLMAFSTASAPVLTTKWRGVPAGAMRFSCGLEAQRQHGLVLGVRVARGHEGQRLEDRADHRGIVLAEGGRGDQGAHVEEAVRLAAGVAIDRRPDRVRPTPQDRMPPAVRRTGCARPP